MKRYKTLSIALLTAVAAFAVFHVIVAMVLAGGPVGGVFWSVLFYNLAAYALPIVACVVATVCAVKDKPRWRTSAAVLFGLLLLTYAAMAIHVTVGLILNDFWQFYGYAWIYSIGIVPFFEFWLILLLRPSGRELEASARRKRRIAGVVLLCVTLVLLAGMLTHAIIAAVRGAQATGTSFPWWSEMLLAVAFYALPLLAAAGATAAVWQKGERKPARKDPSCGADDPLGRTTGANGG